MTIKRFLLIGTDSALGQAFAVAVALTGQNPWRMFWWLVGVFAIGLAYRLVYNDWSTHDQPSPGR